MPGFEIFFDFFSRDLEIFVMKSAGKAAAGTDLQLPPKNSLQMEGLDELLAVYKDIVQLVIDFGSLVEKDARLLSNISEAFKKTDESAAKGGTAHPPMCPV